MARLVKGGFRKAQARRGALAAGIVAAAGAARLARLRFGGCG